jgi:hypothetical protein
MFNSPGNHGHSLGLSVGATNLAGTRDGQTAVIRPAELTRQGQRLTGFVDRVGDPVPLVAPDGSKHRSEELLADALGAMAHAVTDGAPVSDVTVTVPAHWRASVVDTLRRSLRGRLPVISDATAALTALRANPGLPTHGVIVLCDFGGSGTSITLVNAARDFSPFGETVRFADFSGDHIDQALLTHVVAGLLDASHADPSSTAMVGSLVRLRDECRRAKERLSASTATAVAAELPGHRGDIRVTRTELEDLMQAPLSEFLAVLDDTLERYGVPTASVSAVATFGGGARIPLITQRLSENLRAPAVTTPRPQFTAAEGAALIAHRGRVVDTATALTPTAPAAAATATMAAAELSSALAWSEDDGNDDVLPYSDATDSRPEVQFHHEEWQDEQPPRRGPLVLFGLSAAAAAIAAAVFGLMSLSDTATTPVQAATASTTSPAPAAQAPLPTTPAPQAPQVTTVVVQQPAARFNPAPQQPRPQAPVTHQQPTTPPTTTPPPTTPPTTTKKPPTTDPTPPPTPPPPPTSPKPPPIEPGTGTGTPPVHPGTGGGA